MKLSEIFNGEVHVFEAGEDFPEGATLVVADWEDLEEEDELSPFESPSRAVVLRDTRTRPQDSRFPLALYEQAWGGLSVNLGAFCSILGFERKQYQLTYPSAGAIMDRTMWTFITTEHITDRM